MISIAISPQRSYLNAGDLKETVSMSPCYVHPTKLISAPLLPRAQRAARWITRHAKYRYGPNPPRSPPGDCPRTRKIRELLLQLLNYTLYTHAGS